MKKIPVKNIDDISEFVMINQGNTAEIYLYGDTKIPKSAKLKHKINCIVV